MGVRSLHRWALLVAFTCAAQALAGDLIINRSQRFQILQGWGGATPDDPTIPSFLTQRLLEVSVNDLGITISRAGVGRLEGYLNDDGDPFRLNPGAALDFSRLDQEVAENILPTRALVHARGDPYAFWISVPFYDTGLAGAVPTWMLKSEGEYAEFMLTALDRLKNLHGVEPDSWVICNEALSDNAFSAAEASRTARYLGPLLHGSPYSTRLQYPETSRTDLAWQYFVQPMATDHTLWPYVGKFSYHLYGSVDFVPMATFANGLGLPTAQTEFLSATVTDLLNDLTIANVVHWEKYALWGHGANPGPNVFMNVNDATYIHSAAFWRFRQFFEYIRPGAQRVSATAADPNIRAVAFERNGRTTVVFQADGSVASTTVTVRGLPAGIYGITQTLGTAPFTERAPQTVASGGTLTVTVAADTITTIYPRVAGENRRPILTSFGMPAPRYLTSPASQTTLSATAVDPEGASMSWTWAVVSAPPATTPVLATPNAASTQVSGLTASGRYDFRVRVSDGTNTSDRVFTVNVYSGNQAPRINEISARNPRDVALPTTSTTLSVFARDLESLASALSSAWSLVSAPPGATVSFGTPTDNVTTISGMTVAGDYVVQASVTDPQGATTTGRFTVRVYPPDVIPNVSPITATPANVTQPASSTTLSAVTSNGNVGPLTHWWSVVSAPRGSNPRFTARASPTTQVTGLTAVGTYQFELTAISRERFFSRQVSVQVAGAQPNTTPIANAGPDQTVTLPRLAILSGTVADDGKPAPIALTQSWSTVSGPASVTFNFQSAPITNAIFTAPGTYRLRLTASDGALSATDDVVVTVLAAGAGGGTAGGGTAGGGAAGGGAAGGGTAGGGTAGGGAGGGRAGGSAGGVAGGAAGGASAGGGAGGGSAGGTTAGGTTAGGTTAGGTTAGGTTAGGTTAGGTTAGGTTAGGTTAGGTTAGGTTAGGTTAGGAVSGGAAGGAAGGGTDGCARAGGCHSGSAAPTLFLVGLLIDRLRQRRRREVGACQYGDPPPSS